MKIKLLMMYLFAIQIAISSCSVVAQTIEWKVHHSFRLLNNPEDFTKLINQVRSSVYRATQDGSNNFPSPLSNWNSRNENFYLPRTAYRVG